MKRVLVGVTVLGTLAILAGCPIYPSNSDGGSFQVCDSDACFDCPDPSYSDACVYWSCNTSQDCPYGYSCGDVATAGGGGLACLAATAEDASLGGGCGSGCPNGYICAIANGGTSCIPIGVLPIDDAGVVTNLDASIVSSDGSTTVWEDAPFDATSATSWDGGDASVADGALSGDGALLLSDGATAIEAGALGALCNADTQCSTAGAGAKCVDGLCTPQSQLCSDGTQCLAPGEVCVDGICLPVCSASSACAAGYACDFILGVCSGNPDPCTSSASCSGGAVCVEGHCAAPCAAPDSNVECAYGQVCVNGGCIPDQEAQFTCSIDGATCTLSGGGTGVCVHGDCYIACPDGGGCSGAAPVCKSVPDNRGSYEVCGTASDLGDECNAAVGAYCTGGALCVDGYCKAP
jgi:hypothetical protein